MSKEKLAKQFKTVFGYCRAKGKWELDFDDQPYDKLVILGFNYYSLLGIWSYYQFHEMLTVELEKLKSQHSLTDYNSETIIDHIEQVLRSNLKEVFTILPLEKATISKSVFFGDYAIIKCGEDGLFQRNKPKHATIFDDIEGYFKIDRSHLEKNINYLLERKSSGFLNYPLLIIRERSHYEEVSSVDRLYFTLRYNLMFIRLLAQFNNIEPYQISPQSFEKCDHLLCMDKRLNFNSFPIREGFECNYNLDFFKESINQQYFLRISNVFDMPSNDLRTTYLRSIKYINKSFEGSVWAMDDISMQVLFINIAAESLLLFDASGAKKAKLANVMLRLSSVSKSDLANYFSAVDEVYRDRSHFVHAGRQALSKYSPNSVDGEVENDSLKKYKEMMVKILVEFPIAYNNLITIHGGKKALEEWKNYLKSPAIVVRPSLVKRILMRIGKFFYDLSDKLR